MDVERINDPKYFVEVIHLHKSVIKMLGYRATGVFINCNLN